MESLLSHEYRCSCGKLLFKGVVFSSNIEIKCKGCGKINQISGVVGKDNNEYPGRFTFLLNKEGNITDASESVKESLGYSKEEFVGKNIADISQTTNKEMFLKIYDSIVKSDKDVFFHANPVYQAKNGELVKCKVSFRSFRSDGTYLFCVADPATNDFVEDEKFHKMDILCDGYCELSPDMTVMAVGGKRGNFLGYSDDEVLGKKIFEFLSPKETQIASEEHIEAIRNHKFLRMLEIKMKKKDGEIRELDLYFTPNFSDAGQYVGYKVMGWLSKKE